MSNSERRTELDAQVASLTQAIAFAEQQASAAVTPEELEPLTELIISLKRSRREAKAKKASELWGEQATCKPLVRGAKRAP